jgi:capsular exopolysaccharide synthesis family protein
MEHLPIRRQHPDNQPMLMPSASAPSFGGYVEINSADGDSNELKQWLEYLHVVVRRKFTVLAISICGVLLALLYTLYQTPLYMAGATLEVQNISPEPFEGIAFMNTYDPYQVQTQLQLLQSGVLQDRVYAKLSSSPPANSVRARDAIGSIREWLHLPSPRQEPTWEEGIAVAMGTVQVSLVKDTRIVRVVSQSTVPQAAADYANTLAEQFIQQTFDDKWALYQTTGSWLTRAQQELKSKLEASEKQLLTYASESGLIVTSGGEGDVQNIGEQKLIQLQAELTRAQADRIVKESIYRENAQRAAGDDANVLDSGPMANYQMKLADLRRELAEVSTSLTESHPKVRRLHAQIAEIETAQVKERTFIVNRMRTDYEAALRREKQLNDDFSAESKILSAQDERLIRYKTLKREVETYRQLFETTLKRGNEAAVASALRPVSARLVDRAATPKLPFKPNVWRNLSLGLLGGLLAAIALVLLRERTDSVVRVPGANRLQFNVRELGVIPSAATAGELPTANGRMTLSLLAAKSLTRYGQLNRSGQALDSVELATFNRRASIVAESFRTTLTSILMSTQNGHPVKTILVTSPSPREGKSTVVTNLGVALAEINQRVLLVDADLRRPRIHAIFNQANTWGLIDLLTESTPCSDYPVEALGRKTHIPGLFTLPSGPVNVEGARLLYSTRMADLLNRLSNEFDAVLIDTPPVLSVADARILSRLVDAIVLVFRSGQTQREAANMALRVFEADRVPVLGTVLNDWNPSASGYGEYGSYYSYSHEVISNMETPGRGSNSADSSATT